MVVKVNTILPLKAIVGYLKEFRGIDAHVQRYTQVIEDNENVKTEWVAIIPKEYNLAYIGFGEQPSVHEDFRILSKCGVDLDNRENLFFLAQEMDMVDYNHLDIDLLEEMLCQPYAQDLENPAVAAFFIGQCIEDV